VLSGKVLLNNSRQPFLTLHLISIGIALIIRVLFLNTSYISTHATTTKLGEPDTHFLGSSPTPYAYICGGLSTQAYVPGLMCCELFLALASRAGEALAQLLDALPNFLHQEEWQGRESKPRRRRTYAVSAPAG